MALTPAGSETCSSCPGRPLGSPAVMPTALAARHPAELDHAASRLGDQRLGHLVAADGAGLHAPHEPAAAHGLLAGRERVDRHLRAVGGQQPRRAARQRRHHERGEAQIAGGGAGAVGDRVRGVARVAAHPRLVPGFIGQRALGALGHRGHHLDRLHRVGADRRLGREHDRVGAVEDRVGHIGDLGAGRARGVDHRLEHLGGGDRRAGQAPGRAQQLLLHDRHGLDRQLDAEIAAGDHHAVGRADDVLGAIDGLGLLDLGDQRQARVAAHLLDVLGGAHEGQGDHVDADRFPEVEHLEVVGRHRVETARGPGDVEALTRGHRAADLDQRVDLVAAHRLHAQADLAVGQVDDVIGVHRTGQPDPAHPDAALVADFGGAAAEGQVLAGLELDDAIAYRADAQLGPG